MNLWQERQCYTHPQLYLYYFFTDINLIKIPQSTSIFNEKLFTDAYYEFSIRELSANNVTNENDLLFDKYSLICLYVWCSRASAADLILSVRIHCVFDNDIYYDGLRLLQPIYCRSTFRARIQHGLLWYSCDGYKEHLIHNLMAVLRMIAT